MNRLVSLGIVIVLHAAGSPGRAQDAGGDYATRIAKLDERLFAALAELADAYDGKQDPEAAAFFSECLVGLGATGVRFAEIKRKWENDVYYGRVRGGKVQDSTAAIEQKLSGLAREYRSLLNALMKESQAGRLIEDSKTVLHRAVIRAELTRGAHEYVEATQRFNSLRRQMNLRALLWDFEGSHKFILAGWYMSESGDLGADKSDETHITYSSAVAFAKAKSARSPRPRFPLPRHVDELRAHALMRQDLLEPDARRLQLGHWHGGAKIEAITLYAIPRTEYRPDIATPTARSARETVAEQRDNWQDVEESIRANGKRVIYAHYPFADEVGTPYAFGEGDRPEFWWNDPKVKDQTILGVPIMLRFFPASGTIAKTTLTEVQVELKKQKGRSIRCRLYLNGDERMRFNRDLPTILLVPEKHLDKGVKYTISVRCKLEDASFQKSWSFTTREN